MQVHGSSSSIQYDSEPKAAFKKIYYNTHALTLKTAGAERHTQLGYCRHQKTVIKRSLIGPLPTSDSFWIQFKERHRKPCSGIISKWKGKQRNKRQSDKHLLSGEYFPQDTYFSSFMTYSLTPGIYQLHFSCVYHFYSGLVQLPEQGPTADTAHHSHPYHHPGRWGEKWTTLLGTVIKAN